MFSCETHLLTFANDLFRAADLGFNIKCIFLNFAKAFHSASHELHLFKLSKLNIDSNVPNWIQDFLSNQTQHVTANDYSSALSSVTSVVPQGSMLGPLLFLVYINDLPHTIVFSSVKLFADDCRLSQRKKSSDLLNIKKDLNQFLL